MSPSDTVVFVADRKQLWSEIPGGVQICTRDYIDLLAACDRRVVTCPIDFTRRLWPRAKIKAGISLYDGYDVDVATQEVLRAIREHRPSCVAFNQVALIPLLPGIRRHVGAGVRLVILSHGAESGDFLHQVVRDDRQGPVRRLRDIVRLGFLIYREAWHFTRHADAVLSISPTDKEISAWLGARRSIFVPRVLEPKFLDWQPDPDRVGFVGTLNHKPNRDGLEAVLRELRTLDHGRLRVRVAGGPPAEGARLAADHPAVDYVGHLSDRDLEHEAASWAIFLNPIFWQARGASTKLAQGIGWGLPIISTPAGNRGYEWRRGDILTGETAADLARLIVASTASPERLQELAAGVRAVAESGPTYGELAERVKPVL